MAGKTEYVQRSPWRRSTPSMKFGDSPHSSEVQPSLLADAWVCRSCGEFMEFSRPQASPGSCRGCLGTRFSAVLRPAATGDCWRSRTTMRRERDRRRSRNEACGGSARDPGERMGNPSHSARAGFARPQFVGLNLTKLGNRAERHRAPIQRDESAIVHAIAVWKPSISPRAAASWTPSCRSMPGLNVMRARLAITRCNNVDTREELEMAVRSFKRSTGRETLGTGSGPPKGLISND